ncbi:MAG: all-trans-retinol 13,14-reductase [Chitinophagales bacterium]|nr:MAG: all-trans-retinol 13,14-reductase [Chitinophagales bacterium]
MQYDVMIAGGGLGGLVCAGILAQEGMSVCVVEKNNQLGGALQSFRRDRCTFDTSVHYIGGLGEGQTLNRLFRYLNILPDLRLRKYDDDGFDHILFKGDPVEYRLAQGYTNFIKKLTEYFPREKAAIQKYCDDIRYICRQFPMYNLNAADGYGDTAAMHINTRDYLSSLTQNKKLQNVLAGNILLYAGKPESTPLHVHALVINSYIESSWKCIDGSDHIIKLLIRNIKRAGGHIIKGNAVVGLVASGNNLTHAILENGEHIHARNFISGMHPLQMLQMVDSPLIRPAFRKRLASLENTPSAFLVYVAMKKNTFPYRNYNLYVYNTSDVWQTMRYRPEEWPASYAIFYNGIPENETYTDGLALMTYMHYDEVKYWENTVHTTRIPQSRGSEYENFKNQRAEKLIEDAATVLPELRHCISAYHTASPLSFRDYTGSPQGSMYGFLKDCTDPMKTLIPVRTKIPNLLLTGQNLNLHGVLGVAISAVVTCAELIGKEYLLNKIKNA